MFIALCGIDGSGKTTLGAMLARAMRRILSAGGDDADVVFTKLVGNTNEVIRYYKLLVEIDPHFDGRAQNYIFAFERVRTANETLRALLRQHDAVIVDRYVYCDFAFSRARGRDDSMYYTVLEHVPLPDVCFVVDVPAELAVERIAARSEPAWTFQENGELLRRARESYLEVAREFDLDVIDATTTPEESVQAMLRCIARRMSPATAGCLAREQEC